MFSSGPTLGQNAIINHMIRGIYYFRYLLCSLLLCNFTSAMNLEWCQAFSKISVAPATHFKTWAIIKSTDGKRWYYAEGPYTGAHLALLRFLQKKVGAETPLELISGGETRFDLDSDGNRLNLRFNPVSGAIKEMMDSGKLSTNELSRLRQFFRGPITVEAYNPEAPHMVPEFNIRLPDGNFDNVRHAVYNAANGLKLLEVKSISGRHELFKSRIKIILVYLEWIQKENRLSEDRVSKRIADLRQLDREISDGKYDQRPGPETATQIDQLVRYIATLITDTSASIDLKASEIEIRELLP